MPNTKSAAKRIRVGERDRMYNRAWKTRTKTAIKKVVAAVEEKNFDLAVQLFNEAQSTIDKAIVKGVLHKNTAARRKARLARLIANLKETPETKTPIQEND